MALQGYNCLIKAQSSGISMTDEATTTTDDLSYQITDTSKQIIDLNTAVAVEDGGVVTTENYTVDYLNGTITFADAISRTITVSGAYMTPVTVATGKSYGLSVSADTLENTNFGTRYKTYQAGLVMGTASIGRYHVSDDLFISEVLAGHYLIVEFYVSATEKAMFYALVNTDAVDSTVEGLVEENINMQITNKIGV